MQQNDVLYIKKVEIQLHKKPINTNRHRSIDRNSAQHLSKSSVASVERRLIDASCAIRVQDRHSYSGSTADRIDCTAAMQLHFTSVLPKQQNAASVAMRSVVIA